MAGKQSTQSSSPSLKNTKEQILAAYNEVLERLSEKQQPETPREQKKREEDTGLVSRAASHTPENILSDLNGLKTTLIKQLDGLSEKLLDEFAKLADLRQAVAVEQKHLSELYRINETADSLSVLLQAQEEQREKFDLEMQAKRQSFEQETLAQKQISQKRLEELEAGYKDQKEQMEKLKVREEENYRYNLELTRRNETDGYTQDKARIQKELAELQDGLDRRKFEIAAKEQEYENLKRQTEEFPDKIKEAVEAAQTSLKAEMQKEYDFADRLKQTEYQNAIALNAQNIKSLEARIAEQEALIKELTRKSDAAVKQVQDIAYRAIDGAARHTIISQNLPEKEKSS